ncbi:MAG: acyl-CoA reductase, partial [Chitinophagaceae bacterium]|nr:acyl-CoA reductase [Chitinophagaceae bacterium]
FSPISVLHYEYYDTYEDVKILLQSDDNIQCVVGYDFVPFGASQTPTLNDYADNVDTMMFLSGL